MLRDIEFNTYLAVHTIAIYTRDLWTVFRDHFWYDYLRKIIKCKP